MLHPLELIEKYYSATPVAWQILLSHSQQVRDKALSIVHLHPELSADAQFVSEAAMLHDIGIFLCDAPRIHCFGTHHYIEHGYLGAELLRKENLPQHARVAERHTGAGLTLSQIQHDSLPLPPQDFCPETIEEQIICYADKFFSKGHLGEELPLEKIRQTMARYGDDSLARFEKWHQLFS